MLHVPVEKESLIAMKKSKVTRSLLAACSIVALSAVMYGCTHSGDDPAPVVDEMTDTDTDTDTESTPVAVTIPDAMYLDEDNTPMAGMTTIAAGGTHTSGGVMFSCAAGGDACELNIMADGSVTSTGGEVTAALTEDAVTQVDDAKLMYRGRVIGKDRALEAASNLGLTGTAGLDEDEIIISRGPSGPASVTSAGYSMSDDPALPNEGWAGSHLTRTVAGATNHLFVYTDKEAPTRVQFYDFDRDMDTPALYTDSSPPSHTNPYGPADTITGLTLTGGATGNFSADVADLTRFPAPQPVEEGSRTQNYPNNDDTDGDLTNGLEQVSIPGNFNGAGGQYICTGGTATTPCAVTVAPDGTYTLVGTAWTFVPELNATAWQEDPEFMSFGWWLQEPTAATGTYTFQYYADGDAYQLAAGNLAPGPATYNGRAAGKYVVQEIDDTGVTGGNAGMFTAAATLTAMFNGTAAGGTLEGTISGFQTDNMGVDVSGWSVRLNRQTITGTVAADVTSLGTNNVPTAAGFDGATAMMGDQTAHGTWVSQFFGQPATADAYPLGVGGTFQADNEAASIAGAFGARR